MIRKWKPFVSVTIQLHSAQSIATRLQAATAAARRGGERGESDVRDTAECCVARGDMLLGLPLLTWIGCSFVGCFAADVLLQSLISSKDARWYLIHALLNTVVTALLIPDCLEVLRDPLAGLDSPYTDGPLALTVGLHLFHCVSNFRSLTAIDWAHHLVSNMLVSGLCFPFVYGPLVNWACFFVCGLPGGIDYYLLFLVKIGRMEKLTEKKLNRMLNMWLRLPGIISFAPLAFVCWRVGRIQVPGALLVLQAILNAFNAIYFADRVVANCALSIERAKPPRVDKKAA